MLQDQKEQINEQGDELKKKRAYFYSRALHKLRSPLSGAKLLIETMQRGITGELTDKQKEYLEQVHGTSEMAIKLSADIFDLLNMENDGIIVKKERVSISDLYNTEFSAKLELTAKNAGVIINNNLKDKSGIIIETDAQLWRNILEVFILNAVHYSEKGKEIILDVKEEDNVAVFFVKDNGIGIPKDEQEKIFEHFYRASNGKNFKPYGSGLGLYRAKIFAEKIGAEIYFESPTFVEKTSVGKEENKGSIFYLKIKR